MKEVEFHFETNWQIKGSREDVYDLLTKPLDFPLWWPAVYLSVKKEEVEGDTVFALHTKGWLPYTIKWRSRQMDKNRPEFIEVEAFGDLEGRGTWTLTQKEGFVAVHYDWRVVGNKPLIRYFAFLLKSFFSSNHYWAMRKGEISLQMEIDRIGKGLSRTEAPTPPLATFPHRHFYKKQ